MKKKSSTLSPAEQLRYIADNYDTYEHVTPYVDKAYAILKQWAEAGHYYVHVKDLDKNIDLMNDRMNMAVYQRLKDMGFVIKASSSGLMISWEKGVK